ncbi:MAG: DUF1643 domain-containing protein [Flavobacteriaceae bacterium]
MRKGAISIPGKRYRLWRIWDEQRPYILFILLNPSKGDATKDDPSIKRLISFAKAFSYGGLYLGNLYSHVTPFPKNLESMDLNPEQENINHVKGMMHLCQAVVYAWGNHGSLPHWLKEIEDQPLCFGYTKKGCPKHPLYLAKSSALIPYEKKI